jgi:hypothetical protein
MSEKMVEISVSDLETIISEVEYLESDLSLLRSVGCDVLAGKTYDDIDREWDEDFEKNNDVDLSTEEGLSGYICFHDYFRNNTIKESGKSFSILMDLLGDVLDVDWEQRKLDEQKRIEEYIKKNMTEEQKEIEEKERLVEDMIATDDDIPF